MQTKMKIQDVGLSPSFSCYSSDSLTSKAIAKVIHEEHKSSRFDEFRDDFEFSLGISEEEKASADEEIGVKAWKAFPVFDRDRDLLVDREIDGSVSITSSLQKLFIDDHEESSSQSSSSEADELENIRPGTFCLWSPKAESGSSSPGAIITKCKKSSSTGSTGSKKWKIRYSFKRSNSEGNKQQEPMVLLPPNNYKKKMDTISPKQKRSSRKVAAGGGRFVHEQFYVQRRAENEMGKKKSYLPYRKDMFGLFANVNGMGKMLPF